MKKDVRNQAVAPVRDSLAQPKKAAVLAALSETGNVLRACQAAGVGRSSYYRFLREDEVFRAAAADAMDEAADRLEEEARRRAHDGVDEPVFYQGVPCGTIRRYSDTLLIFLLKGARPDKYRERSSVVVEDPAKALAKVLGVSVDDLPA